MGAKAAKRAAVLGGKCIHPSALDAGGSELRPP